MNSPRPARLVKVLFVLSALSAASRGGAQAIDEGTFVVTRSGATVATESFQVVRVPGQGNLIRIVATRIAGDQRITATLTADSLGTPQAYQIDSKRGGVEELHLQAVAAPGRLSSTSKDQHGNESMKDYVVAPGGAVILDEELASQCYLVALHRREGTLKVIVPKAGREFAATLTAGGLETIQVGGRPATATKYTLAAAGGAGSRDFWVDSAGRVLRVSLPGGAIATRQELPR